MRLRVLNVSTRLQLPLPKQDGLEHLGLFRRGDSRHCAVKLLRALTAALLRHGGHAWNCFGEATRERSRPSFDHTSGHQACHRDPISALKQSWRHPLLE